MVFAATVTRTDVKRHDFDLCQVKFHDGRQYAVYITPRFVAVCLSLVTAVSANNAER